MARPRSLRLILPHTSQPSRPSLLRQHTTPPSPLHPHTPRPLKSPAFILSSPGRYYHPSSLSLPTLIPPPRPASPLPWTWRCHLCSTTYRLSTTRRCLLDGHYFCSNPPPPPQSPSPSPSPTSESQTRLSPPLLLAERGAYVPCAAGGGGEGDRGKQHWKRERKGRKRAPALESCTSAFDYHGWADWNAWRRELCPTVAGMEKAAKDCFRDCDFPSECCWQQTAAYLEAVAEEAAEEGSPVSPF